MPRKSQQGLFATGEEKIISSKVSPQQKKFAAPKKDAAEASVPETPEPVFSVGEFLDYINEVFKLREYAVEGEITEYNPHPTGLYFTLKDKEGDGVLSCYMNPHAYRQLGVPIEAGMLVKVTGTPNIYKPKGRFSFVAHHIELSGEGTLRKAYELLKKKLGEEGLFARKRPLPEFIRHVGVITSRTGAVIDDFRKNLKPLGLQVYLRDVRVEGASAPDQIIRAIRAYNKHMRDLDVIVLIRGGGSLEDMQPFNNEMVARALFGSNIPVIAGIGHDRDVPIASLVADRMTSTPSFAATIVNESWDRLFKNLPLIENAIMETYGRIIDDAARAVHNASVYLAGVFQAIAGRYERSVADVMRLFQSAIERTEERIRRAVQLLSALNPERNLKLGYSIIFGEGGNVIRSADELEWGSRIRARLAKGSLEAIVEKVED